MTETIDLNMSEKVQSIQKALLAAALATVASLALWPQPVQVQLPETVQHLAAFAVLALVARGASQHRSWPSIGVAMLTLGAGMEGLQWAFTDRHAEWGDLAANTVGVAVGLAVAELLAVRARRVPRTV
jgi:VanZ family protein